MSYIGTNGGNSVLAQALPNWKYEHASQIGLHTTEFPAGHTLLALFEFLNTRTTHGAYQAASDSHGASGQYCPWSWAAWGAPSINRWAAHVAGNCRADEWDRLASAQRTNLIRGMALQAHRYSRWQVSQGRAPVPARRLTKAQAERREPGFVYHGALQADRSDPTGPRDVFPWREFLAEYRRLEAGGSSTPVLEGEVMSAEEYAAAVWNDDGDDLVNDHASRRGWRFGKMHEYILYVYGRVQSTDWREWLYGHNLRTRIGGNNITAGNMLRNTNRDATYARQEAREANQKIDAVADAVSELVGQVDQNTRRALEEKLADIKTEAARVNAEDVADELKISVKEDN